MAHGEIGQIGDFMRSWDEIKKDFIADRIRPSDPSKSIVRMGNAEIEPPTWENYKRKLQGQEPKYIPFKTEEEKRREIRERLGSMMEFSQLEKEALAPKNKPAPSENFDFKLVSNFARDNPGFKPDPVLPGLSNGSEYISYSKIKEIAGHTSGNKEREKRFYDKFSYEDTKLEPLSQTAKQDLEKRKATQHIKEGAYAFGEGAASSIFGTHMRLMDDAVKRDIESSGNEVAKESYKGSQLSKGATRQIEYNSMMGRKLDAQFDEVDQAIQNVGAVSGHITGSIGKLLAANMAVGGVAQGVSSAMSLGKTGTSLMKSALVGGVVGAENSFASGAEAEDVLTDALISAGFFTAGGAVSKAAGIKLVKTLTPIYKKYPEWGSALRGLQAAGEGMAFGATGAALESGINQALGRKEFSLKDVMETGLTLAAFDAITTLVTKQPFVPLEPKISGNSSIKYDPELSAKSLKKKGYKEFKEGSGIWLDGDGNHYREMIKINGEGVYKQDIWSAERTIGRKMTKEEILKSSKNPKFFDELRFGTKEAPPANTEPLKTEPIKPPTDSLPAQPLSMKSGPSVTSSNTQAYSAWSRRNIQNKYKPGSDGEVKPLRQIIEDAHKYFNVGLSNKRFRGKKAYAWYKNGEQVIESKNLYTIETFSHELGHHLDQKYGFFLNSNIPDMIEKMPKEFTANYKEESLKHEAIAEFVRLYLTQPDEAVKFSEPFFDAFESSLSSGGDLGNLQKMRGDIDAWLSATTIDQIKSNIVSRNKKFEGPKSFNDIWEGVDNLKKRGVTFFFDKGYPLLDFVSKYEKKTGTMIPDDVNPYLKYKSASRASVKALSIINDGLTTVNGDFIDKPFKGLFTDIERGEMEDFEAYLVSKRALDYSKRRKRTFSADIQNEYVEKAVGEYEMKFPHFSKAAGGLYSWWDTFVLEWVVNQNLMPLETYAKIKELDPHYVPFLRDRINTSELKKRGGRGVTDKRNPLRRSSKSGGDDPIFSPVESMIIEIERYVDVVKKREVMLAIDEIYKAEILRSHLARKNKKPNPDAFGIGLILNKIPPSMVSSKIDVSNKKEALKKKINEALEESVEEKGDVLGLIDSVFDDVLTSFKPLDFDKETNIISTIDSKGDTIHYEVYDPLLLETLLDMSTENLNPIINALVAAKRAMQITTTSANPVFIAKNMIRDSVQGAVASDIPLHKYHANLVKAWYQEITNGEWAERYRAAGGGFASPVGADRNALSESLASVRGVNKITPKYAFKKTFHFVEKLSDAIEQAPRIAEFRYSKESGDSNDRAFYKSQDVTVDFGQRGKIMDIGAVKTIPFFNPALQGTYKLFRMLKNKKTYLRALPTLMLPVALLYAINKDDEEYQKLSRYMKDRNFLIPTGKKGVYIRLPKPHELGYIFGATFERALDASFKKDPAAWDDYFSEFVMSLIPSTNTMVSSIKEAGNNKTWYDEDIVPYRLQQVEPDQQYTEETSWISKQLAKIIPDGSKYSSPMILDYILKQNTGIVGKIVVPLTDSVKGNEAEWIFRSFLADSAYSNKEVSTFYDNLNKAQKAYNTIKMGRDSKNENDIVALKGYKEAYQNIKKLNELHDELDSNYELFKALSKETGIDNKKDLKRWLKLSAAKIAEDTNAMYKKIIDNLK